MSLLAAFNPLWEPKWEPTRDYQTVSLLDFSHLAAYHIASVRLSTKALGTFCGSLPQTNPKKVPLQRTCSCWKVHPEKGDKGPRTLFNMVGRGQEPRSALLQNYGEEHIYPYCSQMAKVERGETV